MEGIQCLERRIYERPLTSEPFIENQSEHISKLSLHQSLVKRKFITKRYRRARETSRISLRCLRRVYAGFATCRVRYLSSSLLSSSLYVPYRITEFATYHNRVRYLYLDAKFKT